MSFRTASSEYVFQFVAVFDVRSLVSQCFVFPENWGGSVATYQHDRLAAGIRRNLAGLLRSEPRAF